MIKVSDISFYILAGGQSLRMGMDKGLLPFNQSTFIHNIMNEVLQLSPDLHVISSHAHHHTLPVISDLIPDCGPLGGIYTALHHTSNNFVFILSCDMPLIKHSSILHFIQQCHSNYNTIATVESRYQPLFGLYKKADLPILSGCIENKHYKVLDYLQVTKFTTIDFTSFQLELTNCNTPTDYENILKML